MKTLLKHLIFTLCCFGFFTSYTLIALAILGEIKVIDMTLESNRLYVALIAPVVLSFSTMGILQIND